MFSTLSLNISLSETPNSINRKRGRPPKSTEMCHPKVQRRKVAELIDGNSEHDLSVALTSKLHMEGSRDSSTLVKEITTCPSVSRTYKSI